MQEHINLQQEKQAIREGGATREEVAEHLQRERDIEQNASHQDAFPARENTPSQRERTMSITRERSENLLKHYQTLVEDEERTTDPKEKLFLSEEQLSILREFNNLAAHILYTEMREVSSGDQRAISIKSEIQSIYDNELGQITESARLKTDPGTLALIRTRSLELEKMKAELEIRWIEKRMYDLHVEWSPEKETLSGELQTIVNERLTPLIHEYVSALHDERNTLLKREGTTERSARLGYLNSRLVEFERIAKKPKTSEE